MKFFERLFDFLASIQLAVFVILALAVASAVGTIYESRYDMLTAQRLVYHSPYMYFILGLLCVNLIAVMIDRWPWKRHHAGFVLAHIGIITLLIGSVMTQRMGVDGTMTFEIGDSNRFAMINDTEFVVYSTFDGQNLTPMFYQKVDFIRRPPQEYPLSVNIGSKALELLEYHHFAVRRSEILPSERAGDGPAVRVQLQNANVNLSQWVVRAAGASAGEVTLGPAKIVLSDGKYENKSQDNVIEIFSDPKSPQKLLYRIFTKSQGGKVTATGGLREGAFVETGWMGMQLRLLRYLPQAQERVTYEPRRKANNITNSALKLRFAGEEYWVGLNSVLRLFNDDHMLMISFANRRVDIGFDMKLSRFHIGHYQGTQRAASYESDVEVPGLGHRNISMNEPLYYNSFTFYQASFQQDETGKPIASILSVNYDPGRWVKYLGSFLIVLGSIILFYFKRAAIFRSRPSAKKEAA